MALEGNLKDFSLENIIELINSSKKTGMLEIQFIDNEETQKKASLYFENGEVIYARNGALKGVSAIDELACISRGQFAFFQDKIDMQNKNLLNIKFDKLIKRYKEVAERWYPLHALFPSLKAKIILSEGKGNKIDFTRNEWRTVSSVGNGIVIKNLIEKMKTSEIELLEILKHLKEKGAIEVEEYKHKEIDKSIETIVPVSLRPSETWFANKPIEDKTALNMYKMMNGKKTLSQLAKELNVSVNEGKKALDYLVSIKRASIIKK